MQDYILRQHKISKDFILSNTEPGGMVRMFESTMFDYDSAKKAAINFVKNMDTEVGTRLFDETGHGFFICKNCGSKNVDVKAWVNQNDVHISYPEDADKDETWCNDCIGNHGTQFVEPTADSKLLIYTKE